MFLEFSVFARSHEAVLWSGWTGEDLSGETCQEAVTESSIMEDPRIRRGTILAVDGGRRGIMGTSGCRRNRLTWARTFAQELETVLVGECSIAV